VVTLGIIILDMANVKVYYVFGIRKDSPGRGELLITSEGGGGR
jgi:hypothetical protein